MALILNIDTATDHASIAICLNGELVAIKRNDLQKEHASFVGVAIKDIFKENNLSLAEIDAVAITSGPGSYTGLRVSMASAKGLCYALKKPLIAVNTLQVMATAAREFLLKNDLPIDNDTVLVPMIDARRMEVFTANYSADLLLLNQPSCKLLTPEVMLQWDQNKTVYFFGSGSHKLLSVGQNVRGLIDVTFSALHLGITSYRMFLYKHFADFIYIEPEYFKQAYLTAKM